jgi:hypothetical protein
VHVADAGKTTNKYKVLVEEPEGKRSLRRPSCRWGDNVKKKTLGK